MSKRKTQPQTPDTDNPAWTAEDLVQARPASEVLSQLFSPERAQSLLTPRGRPKADVTKVRVGIRLSPEVIAHFKASGNGWQTRIDAALRQFIAEHPGSRLIERAVGPGSAQPPGLP
ncbi:MAG: BrnA antitoxin family protein [Limnohabitans sp.]|jgi:uncharacterized protein (DUF4415 family)|uniref:BrnA antitoxin family protein n=1 Tax=Limnohabitans sp. TaxID=1907725 RepID=UPI00391ABCE9